MANGSDLPPRSAARMSLPLIKSTRRTPWSTTRGEIANMECYGSTLTIDTLSGFKGDIDWNEFSCYLYSTLVFVVLISQDEIRRPVLK